MPLDVTGDKTALRHDAEPLFSDVFQYGPHQPRPDALPFETFGHFGVGQDDVSRPFDVLDCGRLVFDAHFVTLLDEVVHEDVSLFHTLKFLLDRLLFCHQIWFRCLENRTFTPQ